MVQGAQPRWAYNLNAAAVLRRRRVRLGRTRQAGHTRPRSVLELVRAAATRSVVAAGLVLADAGPVGRAGARRVRRSAARGCGWHWWRSCCRNRRGLGTGGRGGDCGRLCSRLGRRLCRCLCGCLLLLLRRNRLEEGEVGVEGRLLLRRDGVVEGCHLGDLLGLRIRHQLELDLHRPVLADGLVAGHPRRSCGGAAEQREKDYWCDNDGHRRRECNADPHGTSLRRAR